MNLSHIQKNARPLLAGACLLLALTACGADAAPPPPGPPALGALRVIHADSDIDLPLDAFTLSWHDRVVMETAREELTARCMASAGFPGYPVTDLSAYGKQPIHGNLFGLYSRSQAATSGFRPTWLDGIERSGAEVSTRFEKWSTPAIMKALNGVAAQPLPGQPQATESKASAIGTPAASQRAEPAIPNGGCAEEGRRLLFALADTVPIDTMWQSKLEETAFTQAGKDARMSAATQTWRSCMKKKGYVAETPAALSGTPRWLKPMSKQRKAALADVACKDSSRYVDTQVALTAAYQQRLVESNRDRLASELATKKLILSKLPGEGLGKLGGSPGGTPPAQ